MALIFTPNLEIALRKCSILVDTCILIDASNDQEFAEYLSTLRKADCTFLSLPSVRNEFTCIAKNMKDYDKLSAFFEAQQIILLPKCEEKLLTEEGVKFGIMLQRSGANRPSYVDRSLLFVPYIYKDTPEQVYLMTSNHKDIPKDFYDLEGFITYKKSEFHTVGIYKFNSKKFYKMAEAVLG